jgi:sugar lactone lactonase YvrE
VASAGPRLGGGEAKLLRVDPDDGKRTVLTVNAAGQPGIFNPAGVAVDGEGALAVTDFEFLLRVDPVTGNRTLISGWTLLARPSLPPRGFGPPFDRLGVLAVEEDGRLVVVDAHPALPNTAALFRVDPASGDRVFATR